MEDSTDQAVLASYRRHAAPYITDAMVDCVVDTAQGATLHCTDGRRLIDLASGGFGYAHPEVKAAVAAQIRKAPLSSRVLISRPLAELVVQLDAIAPNGLGVSYVCNSGEEALDSALKLTKGYWPTRRTIVVIEGADYGTLSHGTLFAGLGEELLSVLPFRPKRIAFGDIEALQRAVDDDCAAVLFEPLSIGRGTLEAPTEFWRAMRSACDRSGALMIDNELRTCLGRSGTTLAIERTGTTPDVIIVGGALGGGHISIGAYITSERINSKVYDNRNPTLHGSTTGGNPASCAAALAALSVMQRERLAARHETFGLVAAARLKDAQRMKIRAVQRAGSLVVIDFEDQAAAEAVRSQALALGLLLRRPDNARIVLNPPLIASASEFEHGAELLYRAIAAAAGEHRVHDAMEANA